ncbi:alpha/beta hydrolase [Nocardioides sp. Root1257]|uniref:alpha/beta fold hydrolase n=1 Tax=unclassified Nocardioides TaxID=2615069 RepID=UPI0006FA0B6F|nr:MULTISPECIES: alpha/beta hydrolase [unclassified Nocardioides]KQW53230.1 alpha/beta hydrolase [Nocardioides sp. Root1257]KRC55917.1 alpha/beta hydrolase [Nocardioides sp. Root224]
MRPTLFARLAAVTALVVTASLAAPAAHASLPAPTASERAATKPTIVLVHGAFADSSGWADVSARLTARGFDVIAFSNPLRGPVADGEYLRQFLSTIPGKVVLVGHSYGGAVITNASTGNPHVKALVYVAAYAPDEGESVAAANELGGGHTVVTDHLVLRPYPGAPEGDADAYIDPAWFHRLFAQDLPRSTTAFMAATQRPGALSALVSPSGEPGWRTIPSWYLVARQDRIIPPHAERRMAKRAGARTVVINSSHVAMMSHPKEVTALIRKAAR